MIQNLDYSRLLYYPAGGTDVQAILRFSHVVDTILSPTVSSYLTKDRYELLFNTKCKTLNNHFGTPTLELVDSATLDASFIRERKFVDEPAALFSESEKHQYMSAFKQYMDADPKIFKFKFKRTIGKTERLIDWIAMSTEGLATLVSIKQSTGKAPSIICTIQTGMLEKPDSLFVRMVERTNIRPKIWVRGAWACHDKEGNSIRPFPPFDQNIQDFGYWNSLLGAQPQDNEDIDCDPPISKVRAFSDQPDFAESIPSEVTIQHPSNSKRTICIKRGNILTMASDFDFMFCHQSITLADGIRSHHWDSFRVRPETTIFPDLTLAEALASMNQAIGSTAGKRIGITPIGYEDETPAIHEFLGISDEDLDLTIVHKRPLDFWDLKLAAR